MTDSNPGGFGNIPTPSETFGTVPQDSEVFGNIPNNAETFRMMRKTAERTDQHTLTVREVARLFEQAGVPRTERSITNWAQPNHQGIARLDAFFDTNERKYFLTPQSVTAAIGEERAKGKASGVETPAASANNVPHASERAQSTSDDTEGVKSLELKLRDLEITNRAKDYYIDQMKEERAAFQAERQNYVERLIATSREVGELRSRLLLGGGTSSERRALPNDSETPAALEYRKPPVMNDASFRLDGEADFRAPQLRSTE